MDPTDYDFEVFRITSEICRQVFPVELDLDNPAFARTLDRLWTINRALAAARARGGVVGKVKRVGLMAAAGAAFVRLYLIPAKSNKVPARVRLAPAW